jgi:hypothetical protein
MTVDQIISSIGALAGIIQAVFVVVTIIYINRQFAIVRACSYIERFNSQDSIIRRVKVDGWLRSSENDENRIKAFEDDESLRCDILGFINLFQELGVAYLGHNVHKKTVRETFDFLIPYYWKEMWFLIGYLRRTRGNPTLYRKFEYIAENICVDHG